MGSSGIGGSGRLYCGALDAITKQRLRVRLNFLP